MLSNNEEENDQPMIISNENDCDGSCSESESTDIEEASIEEGLEEAVQQFTEYENDHAMAFIGWRHNSCFVHTLQLVVKEFEKDPCFKSALNKAKQIVKKVNKSCKATEMLVKAAKKKLVSDCPTRWDSTYLMISRLLGVKDHINAVLEELGSQHLNGNSFVPSKNFCSLLHIKQMWQALKRVQASAWSYQYLKNLTFI